MTKPTCQISFNIEVETAEYIESIAKDFNLRPNQTALKMLEQRIELEKEGWVINDMALMKKNI